MAEKRGLGGTILALVLVAVTSAACITVGSNFDAAPVLDRQLVTGRSTRADVAGLFGQPWKTGIENGRETWTYAYEKWKLFGEVESKELYVVFDSDGRIYSYNYNSNVP